MYPAITLFIGSVRIYVSIRISKNDSAETRASKYR